MRYEFERLKIRWFAQLELKQSFSSPPVFQLLQILRLVIDGFTNLSPSACSRIWCNWVSGFEKLGFHFSVRK